MHQLLGVATGIALLGICIMLFGIGFIRSYPTKQLPEWVKLVLLLIAVSFIVTYSMLVLKAILALI